MKNSIITRLDNIDLFIWWSDFSEERLWNNAGKSKPEVRILFKYPHETDYLELVIFDTGTCDLAAFQTFVFRNSTYSGQNFATLSVNQWQAIACNIFSMIFACKNKDKAVTLKKLKSYLNSADTFTISKNILKVDCGVVDGKRVNAFDIDQRI